ncbi:MAG: ABC transporter ATP-binding protein [Methanomassiliicoccales archaeon]|nr:ABC transporter ATP-binding protein [Methanomassiliicoccales archaeon]
MIDVEGVSKVYTNENVTVRALDNVSVSIGDSDFVLIVGRSGSGKSTLLSILGGLTRPTAGVIKFEGEDIWSMNDVRLSALRSKEMGFVFQFPGLLPTLTALENVMVPGLFSRRKEDATKRASELMESLGLGDKFRSYPHQLSGGELKRTAIARSLFNDPSVILADEPTGDLDADTEIEIMNLIKTVNQRGKTIIMVTHNPELSVFAKRVLRMEKGRLKEV